MDSVLMTSTIVLVLMGALSLGFLARYLWLLILKESEERAIRAEASMLIEHDGPMLEMVHATMEGMYGE